MNIHSRITLFISLVLLQSITSCSKESIHPEYHYKNIHDLVVNTVSSENIPGMVAAIIDSSGILQIESAGVRKTGSPEQITDKDYFHLGSCGKAMTSAMIATLVAEDKIEWETTLIEVFPELEDSILGEYRNITLHQLLTHRAGIANQCDDCSLYEDLNIEESRYLNMITVLKEPSQLDAGDYYYSNIGYVIAGIMAERITGQSWETLMKNRIFEPLGMSSAGFGPPGTISQIDQPWGHNKSNGEWQPSQLDNPEEAGPAGTIHCSMEDWAKFISIYLKQDNTAILERKLIDKLIEPVGTYACGWVVEDQDRADGLVLAHNGSNAMWYASVWVAPNLNRAFIACTNSFDNNTKEIMQSAINNLIKIYPDNN
jgi:CubicO group peptidase (beta-lactamase class C family)